MTRRPIYILLLAAVAFALYSCSTKKNTAGTRFFQAFTTRYNVYFNGEEHYKEQIQKMEKEYEDDYSDLVYIHPAEAYADPKAPQPSADFERTIEKMEKAIALHSIQKRPKKDRGKMKNPKYREFLKRGEYNPFLHNAWRLMGEAQYLKGDFLASSATFMYVEKNFTWLPELVAERGGKRNQQAQAGRADKQTAAHHVQHGIRRFPHKKRQDERSRPLS